MSSIYICAGLVLENMRGPHVQHCQQMSIGTLGIPNIPGTVAAIPVNPMECDGITWDIPQSPISYASTSGVHLVPVYHGMGWDMELCGTFHAVPSHPMVHCDEMDTWH